MSSKKKATEVEVLANNWIAVQSKTHSNRKYYFNTVTKKSTWKNPCKKSSSSGERTQVSSTGDIKKRKGNDCKETERVEKPLKISPKKSKEVADKLTNKNVRITKVDQQKCKAKNNDSECKSISQKFPSCSKDIALLPGKSSQSGDNSGQKNLRSSTNKVSFTIRSRSNGLPSVSRDHEEKVPYDRKKVKAAAQARLLAKRKSYEELVKQREISCSPAGKKISSNKVELEDDMKIIETKRRKHSDFNASSSDSVNNNVVRKKAMDVLQRRIKEDRIYQERVSILGQTKETAVKDNVTKKEDDSMCRDDEEMDWEPMEQEVMIEHIKTLRKNLDAVNELSEDIAMCTHKDFEEESQSNKLVLVFDTNVFISCLPFIKDIQNTFISGLGLPNIFIPWRVLQELDHLKNSSNNQLQLSAIKAIRFINNNFASRHPRVSGQSFEEFSSMRNSQFTSPDDEILLVCLKLKGMDSCKTVILITNDKNLESKALVSNVEAFSKERFVAEKINKSKTESSACANSSLRRSNTESKEDVLYCKLNDVLKNCFAQLLEAELKNAFDNDWRRLVRKKPPWTLLDIMECLIKHWRAVFSFVFQKDVLLLVKDLNDHLQKSNSGHKVLVEDIIQVSRELLTVVKDQTGTDKSYRRLVEEAISDVENLQKREELDKPQGNELPNRPSPTPASCSTFEPPSTEHRAEPCSTFDRQLYKEKVKNVFQIIWDQVRNLCGRISELVASNGMKDEESINQIRCQFPAAIQKVQELVEIAEKILSLGPGEASQLDQIILHFANFLVGLNVFEIDGSELSNFPMYIAMFCGDNEGRQVLFALVNDLKQFGFEMVNGMKALGFV